VIPEGHDQRGRLEEQPTSAPLRILVVIATPSDLDRLDVGQEKAIIEEALAEWRQQGRIEVQVIEEATVANINQAMRSFQPHVFHFVGHGGFDGDQALVMLVDAAGRADPVDERTFREFFADCQSTRLALLNACQTATASSTRPLAGLAPNLLQRQLSAVVAMQYPISDRAALIFSREFYRCLALGYGVDAAVSEARKGILMEAGAGSAQWGVPVLFLRAKDGQLFQIEEPAPTRRLDIPAPPEPVQPPEVANFIGRETELSYYAEQMQQSHLAVIVGMPGMGKTSLAAVLARRVATPAKTFWHSFRLNEGLDILIWKLAGFLAWRQRPALWEMLQGILQSGGQLPPLNLLLDYLCQMLSGENYLLCLDDFQYVDRDPLLESFAERIVALCQAGQLTVLITSHRIPAFARDSSVQPLGGMSRIDTVRMLRARQIHLSDDLVDQLYHATEGNAEFLSIAVNALARAEDPARLIARLTQSDNIEHYLLNELDGSLTEEERNIECTVAVLGAPSTRDAIEITLDAGNLRRPLHNLSERYLLTALQEDQERIYGQHAILQAFYYDQPSRRQRQQLHRRAADYYLQEEEDILKAARHYWQAGEAAIAAGLATKDVRGLINEGKARPLQQLLALFTEQALSPEMWIETLLARGQVYTLLGEPKPAQASYEEAYARLQRQAEIPATHERRARACQGMGELLQYRQPQEALAWLQRGLAELAGADLLVKAPGQTPPVAILIQIQVGSVQMSLGNYSAAINALEEALLLLPSTPNSLRADALLNLGATYGEQGNLEHSQVYSHAALEISWRKATQSAPRIYDNRPSPPLSSWAPSMI
jgi:tetratricopeptide (TPR) repeat protein